MLAEQAAAEAAQEARRQQELARQAELEQQRAQEQAAAEQALTRRRQQKHRKNQKLIQDAPTMSLMEIVHTARSFMRMWSFDLSPGLEFPIAYMCLSHKSVTHAGFPELIRCIVRILRQGLGHHHIHPTYASVPLQEREEALTSLRESLNAYGAITNRELLDAVPQGDPYRTLIRNRIHAIELAAQNAQLQHDLAHNPVVFQRDPDGSINLQAFGRDNQNVHRSSVQNATHRAALALLERPLLSGQDTLPEILADFNLPGYVRWVNTRSKDLAITEITNDYFTTEAFSLKYGDVLDHVWAFIKPHANKQDLVLRLAQEVCEGVKMCTNGKMARLINVLQGYDETLEFAKPKELFQSRMALLVERPLAERGAEARALFAEFDIPEDQHEHWLTPLLEA